MREHSETRRELEASIRSLIPTSLPLKFGEAKKSPLVAGAGVGGLLSGYAWGWLRGRRGRKKRPS